MCPVTAICSLWRVKKWRSNLIVFMNSSEDTKSRIFVMCVCENDHEKMIPAERGAVLPASIPTMEPMAACKQMSGEQMNRATRNTPPVQGLSQPYTWPTPTGMACSSCKVNRIQVTGVWAGHAKTRLGARTEPFLGGGWVMGLNGSMAVPSSV